METAMDLLEVFPVDMGIDFSSHDVRMAEHFLDCPKIGASLK
jgi:hypothetical protein